jgi:hypothetical protein
MATSIYVYDCKETYEKMYKDFQEDKLRECPLLDLYVKGEQLLVVTNTSMHKEQPRMERTIVHFRNGDLGKWESGTEKLVKFGSLYYNHNKNKLDIFPKFLRKPELQLRVDRYYGEKTKRKEINYAYRYYDLMMDRINLVLESKDGV